MWKQFLYKTTLRNDESFMAYSSPIFSTSNNPHLNPKSSSLISSGRFTMVAPTALEEIKNIFTIFPIAHYHVWSPQTVTETGAFLSLKLWLSQKYLLP